jgi:thiol-disulfide isomerase/thioredoxin
MVHLRQRRFNLHERESAPLIDCENRRLQMFLIVLLAGSILICTFIIAGIAKLRDREGTARTLIAFGVPGALSAPVASVLPIVELIIASLLCSSMTAWFGATSAVILLLLFTAAIGYSLMRGRTPACNCFGQVSAAPISRFTLLRNLLLTGCAMFISVTLPKGAGLGFSEAVKALSLREVLLALAVPLIATEFGLMLQMLKQQGRILGRLDQLDFQTAGEISVTAAAIESVPPQGLPIGALAPNFGLDNLERETITTRSLLSVGRPLVLLFMNPECGPCVSLMPEVAGWMQDPSVHFQFAIISEGTPEDNRKKGESLDPKRTLLQQKREVADAYNAWGTPAAVLVRTDGKIGSSVAQGADNIRLLLDEHSSQMHRGSLGYLKSTGKNTHQQLASA